MQSGEDWKVLTEYGLDLTTFQNIWLTSLKKEVHADRPAPGWTASYLRKKNTKHHKRFIDPMYLYDDDDSDEYDSDEYDSYEYFRSGAAARDVFLECHHDLENEIWYDYGY